MYGSCRCSSLWRTCPACRTPAVERRAIAVAHDDDATDAPLRVTVLDRSCEEHILCARFAHLVADGASTRIVVDELAAAYAPRLAGRDPPRMVPVCQQADVAHWQHNDLPRAFVERNLDEWDRHLRACPLGLDLFGATGPRAASRSRFPGVALTRTPDGGARHAGARHAIHALARAGRSRASSLHRLRRALSRYGQETERDATWDSWVALGYTSLGLFLLSRSPELRRAAPDEATPERVNRLTSVLAARNDAWTSGAERHRESYGPGSSFRPGRSLLSTRWDGLDD